MLSTRRAIAVLLIGNCPLSILYSANAAAVRGVSPSDEGAYANTEFTCFDRSKTLAAIAVNDDFCDCADGSDEPGTAACAGLGAALKLRGFYCPNDMGSPQFIYFSRVGDGICDCCDGSDEWQSGVCKDVCEERGRAQRERMEKSRHDMRRGIEKRQAKMAEVQGQAEEWNAKLATLESTVPALEADLVASREALDAAENLVRKSKGIESQSQTSDGAAEEGSKGDGPVVSEYAKWMETDNTKADGESAGGGSNPVQVPRKTVSEIRVRSGDLVDFVEFVYSDGETLLTGGGNGNKQEPFVLQVGEGIVEVKGGQGGLLDSIQFVTTSGRESKSYGGGGGTKYSMRAVPGKVIVGLERTKAGAAGKIVTTHECDFVDNRSEEEKARDEVALVYSQARSSVEAKKSEIQDLKAKISGDFSDAKAAYRLFTETCAEGQLDKYRYSICVFGEAKQGHTRLGTWARWESGERSHVALYENGERCFSGKTRSARVIFECGEDLKIENVREPSQCAYEATVTHPAACDPKLFELAAPGSGNQPVLQPHESVHDEL